MSKEHVRETHKNSPKYKCGYEDDVPHSCVICDYFTCINCGGSEGELPLKCPVVKMTQTQKEAVMRGELDLDFDGKWYRKYHTENNSMSSSDLIAKNDR